MSCNCKKTKVELPPEPTPQPIPQPQEEDWYNNIDIIEPIPQTPDQLLAQELNNWNGGQTKN